MATKAFVEVTQTGSPIGRHHSQRATLVGLGLNKIGRVKVLENTPAVQGMINKVAHLIEAKEVDAAPKKAAPKKTATKKASEE